MKDTNYLDVGCSKCGHVPQSEKHLCDTTPETELKYCTTCIQMTNHNGASCLKCGIKGPYINVEYLLRGSEDKELFEGKIKHLIAIRDTYWKEQLQKVRKESRWQTIDELKFISDQLGELDFARILYQYEMSRHRDKSELDQDITSTTWNPDIEGMKRVGKEWNELDRAHKV